MRSACANWFYIAVYICPARVDRSFNEQPVACLQGGIEDLNEDVAVKEAFAPNVLEVGKGLGSDGFPGGFSSGLQLVTEIGAKRSKMEQIQKTKIVAILRLAKEFS